MRPHLLLAPRGSVPTDRPRAFVRAFTLIELLIVVAIIAILAAIAVPNFLEAQTRSKVTRAKADMRTMATAVEAYAVDNNKWPTGWEILVNPAVGSSHSLFLLSTPIAYITSGNLQDPFQEKQDDTPMYTTYQWDPMTTDGRMFSIYNMDGSYLSSTEQPTWWLMFSVGPDHSSGFYSGDAEYDVQQFFREADTDMNPWLGTFYDPTNGTVSTGNVYRAGGGPGNRAGMFIQGHH